MSWITLPTENQAALLMAGPETAGLVPAQVAICRLIGIAAKTADYSLMIYAHGVLLGSSAVA